MFAFNLFHCKYFDNNNLSLVCIANCIANCLSHNLLALPGRFDGKLGLVPATFLSNKSTEVEEQKISQASNSISQTESQSVSLLGLSTTSSGKVRHM